MTRQQLDKQAEIRERIKGSMMRFRLHQEPKEYRIIPGQVEDLRGELGILARALEHGSVEIKLRVVARLKYLAETQPTSRELLALIDQAVDDPEYRVGKAAFEVWGMCLDKKEPITLTVLTEQLQCENIKSKKSAALGLAMVAKHGGLLGLLPILIRERARMKNLPDIDSALRETVGNERTREGAIVALSKILDEQIRSYRAIEGKRPEGGSFQECNDAKRREAEALRSIDCAHKVLCWAVERGYASAVPIVVASMYDPITRQDAGEALVEGALRADKTTLTMITTGLWAIIQTPRFRQERMENSRWFERIGEWIDDITTIIRNRMDGATEGTY